MKRIAAFVAVLMLGACRLQQPWEAEGAAAPAPVATVLANAAPVPEAVPQKGVVFAVVPGEVHACAGRDHVVARIHWQVSRPGVSSVQVYVSSLSAGRKLFAEGAATGDAKTGDWMSARAVVELVDPRTNAVLASHTMGVLPCE